MDLGVGEAAESPGGVDDLGGEDVLDGGLGVEFFLEFLGEAIVAVGVFVGEGDFGGAEVVGGGVLGGGGFALWGAGAGGLLGVFAVGGEFFGGNGGPGTGRVGILGFPGGKHGRIVGWGCDGHGGPPFLAGIGPALRVVAWGWDDPSPFYLAIRWRRQGGSGKVWKM
jgi:hypothetical protein